MKVLRGRLRALLLDAFNTLFNAVGLHEEATRLILAELGLEGLDAREVHVAWDAEAEALMAERPHEKFLYFMREGLRRCLARWGVELSPGRLEKAMAILVRVFRDGPTVFEDALELLEFCRGLGLKTAIVSNADAEVLNAVLARTGLRDRVDLVVISDEVGTLKPDPRIFEAALSGLGVGPGEAMMVGDQAIDVEGARRAGLRTALVLRPPRPRLSAMCPDVVVDDLRALKGLIAALARGA